jgi:dienelactone hydrolase
MARAALGRGGPPPPVSAEKSVVAALDAASPAARLRVSKLPPRSLFVGGSRDSVVPASQSTRFATALRAAGAAAVTDTVIDADHADFVTAWGGWGRVEGVPSQWGESVVEFVLK